MKGVPLPRAKPAPGDIIYPDSDPDPMAETPVHFLAIVSLIVMLRDYFRDRPDVYVIGDVFWYYEEGNPRARKAPDLMVVKGVDAKGQRRSYKDWEGGVRPCFIAEVLSEETAEEDTKEKHALYERLGVREYFLFDPEGLALERPLVGYRLINKVYEALSPALDGSIPSSELGLRVRPDGDLLALINSKTGVRLPDPPALARKLLEVRAELADAAREREEAERRAEREKQRAEQEKQRAEQERQQKEEARQRAEQERQRAETQMQQAEQERQRAEQERREKEEAQRRAAELAQEVERLRALLAARPAPDDAPPGAP